LWETRRFGVNGWVSSFLVGLLDIWWFLGVFGFGGVRVVGVDASQSDSEKNLKKDTKLFGG